VDNEGAATAAGGQVFVAGYYGFGNEGDEAILEGLRAGLRALRSGLSWVVTSGNPEQTSRRHSVASIPWTDPAAIADAVASSALVVVGGGGLFQDYWGCDPATLFTPAHTSITFYGLPIVLAALLGKPAVLHGIGVGPLRTESGRRFARALADAATRVSVRDKASRDLLVSVGVAPERPVVTADLSFGLDAPGAPAPNPREQRIGVALRHWAFGPPPDQWEGDVAEGLDRYLDQRPEMRALFIPLQAGDRELEDDRAVAHRVREGLRHRSRTDVLPIAESPRTIREAFGRCRVVLGMRLHAVLFSMAAGRPVVGLGYDPKIASVLSDAGQAEGVIRLEELPHRDLARMLDEAQAVDPAHVERLRRGARAAAMMAIEAMDSGEPARLAPELGRIVVQSWKAQIQTHLRQQASLTSSTGRPGELHRRWLNLAVELKRLGSTLRGR
jgi:polysaccharide pyruvyl transferase CsaB